MTANVLSSLAGLECMLGRFDQARQAYGRARAMYEELGLRMPLAGLTTIGVPLELLAGDPVAAEAEARYGIAILEPGGLEGELSPALAEALLAQGRFDDAVGALCPPDASHGTAWQVQWLMVRSRLDSGLGDTVAAVEHAHAATELAAGMDDLNLAADAWLALGLALALAGSQQDAVAAENRARRLYAEKGNLVALDRARVSPLSPEGLRSL
jgi:tetratricopeptide (TPR) repeat protein